MYVNDASNLEIRDFTDQAHQNAGAHAYLVGQQTRGGPAKDVDLIYQLTSMPSLLKAEAAQRIAFQAPFGFDEEGNRSVLRFGGYNVKEPRSKQRPTRLALDVSLPQYFPEQTHIGVGTSFHQQSMISTQDKVQHGVRLVGGVYLGEKHRDRRANKYRPRYHPSKQNACRKPHDNTDNDSTRRPRSPRTKHDHRR